MAFLEIDSLRYTYPEGKRPALQDINLEIQEGEMVLLVGNSGSGKSSLLRALCRLLPDFYGGDLQGRINLSGKDLSSLSRRQLTQTVGMVYENPENQLVMTTVMQELGFGLENLAVPVSLGLQRIGEAAEALGLTPVLDQAVNTLSGGQKQKTALGAVIVLGPKLLLLDEPTSRLDPVASEEVFSFLRRLNEENGLTIIVAEHRLERCYHWVDRIIYMDDGQIIKDDKPAGAARWGVQQSTPMVPPVPAFFAHLGYDDIPLTVKEGRCWLKDHQVVSIDEVKPEPLAKADSVLQIKNLSYAYPGCPTLLKAVNLTLMTGSITALMGANGSGKTTLGKNIMGLLKPAQGSILLAGRELKGAKTGTISRDIGYLPQETGQYFFQATVRNEIDFNIQKMGKPNTGWWLRLQQWFDLTDLFLRHPRDLSLGERQKAALACVLLPCPRVLILDEPTQGLDTGSKQTLGIVLRELVDKGIAVLLITHDIEFAAENADRVAFIQQGILIGQGETRDMLAGNTFYSPQLNRLLGGRILTLKEALQAVQLRPAPLQLVADGAKQSLSR